MSTEKHPHELSLLHDMMQTKGVAILDIYGYVSHEFGDPCFKLTRIVLVTGHTFYVEGEHDHPYITDPDEVLDYPEDEEGDK